MPQCWVSPQRHAELSVPHSLQSTILWDVRCNGFRTYVGFHVSIEEIQSLVVLVTESISQVKTQPHFSSLWSPPRPPTSMLAGGRWTQTSQRGRLTGINFASWPSGFAPPTLKWGSGGRRLAHVNAYCCVRARVLKDFCNLRNLFRHQSEQRTLVRPKCHGDVWGARSFNIIQHPFNMHSTSIQHPFNIPQT
jgi:hypothetical protein